MTTSFPVFSLLPKEIRIVVWNLALQPALWNYPENKSKALPIIDALEEPGKIAKEDKVEEDPQDEAKDPDHGDEDKSSSSVEDNDDDEDNDETSETPRILRPMQFYSPSPLPSRLSVSSEARSVALAGILKRFPTESN
ncbi:hypothetical protein WAI453_005280 [Rhynchosporium graminicola]